jgi:tetratricopeptide (TPR) repeat protein
MHARGWSIAIVLVTLMATAVGLQAVREKTAPLSASSESLLYVPSPEAMKRLALSYDSLLADVYWIRAVQHYGGTKLSNDPNKTYSLLYPLLDLTTSLDPQFNIAYHFGALFLAEQPPGGPGRPDLSIKLLEKGLKVRPDNWEYTQAIGFVYYWWYQDYTKAAEWFKRASLQPGAPVWMASLAAVTLAEGGRRDGSRLLWQQIAKEANEDWFRKEAARRLAQLDAMDALDQLGTIVETYKQRYGNTPDTWSDLTRAGLLPGTPVDSTELPFRLESGAVTLDPRSPLLPLPKEPVKGP